MSLTQQILAALVSAVVPMALFRLILKMDEKRKARREHIEAQRYAVAHR
jgi:hypothetical protein